MKIAIDMDTETDDPTLLAAVFDALAGRAPEISFSRTPAPSALPTAAPSESMIRTEAARVADAPPPPPAAIAPDAPPAAIAPDAPPPPPAAAPAAGPLDSKGTPWDARIHADSKGTNADGQYKRRKGVDVPTYDRIAGELRATVPNGAAAPTESPAAAATTAPDAPPPPPPTSADGPPAPPAPPAAPPPPPASAAAGGMTGQMAMMHAGKKALTYEQNSALCVAVGLAGPADLLSCTPEQAQAFVNMLEMTYGPVA